MIVLDWVKIRHVLTALKMTVQYIMDNCAEGLWMNGKKNLNKYLCFGKFKDFMTVKK